MQAIIDSLKSISSTFLEIKKEQSLAKKGAKTGVGWASFWTLQWVVIAATQALVTFLRGVNFDFFQIFAILWVGSMILGWGVLFANDKLDVDFTAMRGFRNLVDASYEKFFLMGILLEGGFFLCLLLYAGPEKFIIFFDKYFSSKTSRIVIFTLANTCCMCLWTVAYVFCANSLIEVFRIIWR